MGVTPDMGGRNISLEIIRCVKNAKEICQRFGR